MKRHSTKTSRLALLLFIAAAIPACSDDGGVEAASQNVTESTEPAGQMSEPVEMPGTQQGIFAVHASLLHTGKVLFFSGHAEVGYKLESATWDPETGEANLHEYKEDLFCSGKTFLADGKLAIAGGSDRGQVSSLHVFDPIEETYTKRASMSVGRWYPTVMTLADGRVLTGGGARGGLKPFEIYDPEADEWATVEGAHRRLAEEVPGLHLLPSGHVFNSRVGWDHVRGNQRAAYLTFTAPLAGSWTELETDMEFSDRQEGMAIFRVDDTVSPPSAEVIVFGGGTSRTTANQQSVEAIDLTDVTSSPKWVRRADMNLPRTNINAVTLPDGNIFIVGGQAAGKWAGDPKPALDTEIYNPATDTWTVTAPLTHPRQYHSTAVLLPDGRVVIAGGVDPTLGGPPIRDQRTYEIFSPPYLFIDGERPVIEDAPDAIGYGSTITVETKLPSTIASAMLITPQSVTHHTHTGRSVALSITERGRSAIRLQAPRDGNVAPPGYYMLFIDDGVPSVAKFVTVGQEEPRE